MEHRTMKMSEMAIRQEGEKRFLEGHFAVFDQPYEVVPGWIETVAPGAFARVLSSGKDTKVLWNHNPDIVMGSTGNRTANLREDQIGLMGSVEINEMDQAAKDGYARVSRGDVTGCSFGFEISKMEESWDDDGTYRTRILEVYPLYEVSPCTFPAYTQTNVSARSAEQLEEARERFERAKEERKNQWRERMIARLKGEKHGS